MNHLDKQYQELLFDVIENGVTKETRNGKTKSLFGKQIYHDMGLGFPLLTTKKMYWKGIVTELLWFLRGDTDIRFLWYNNCSIWDGDWYKTYKTTCSEPYTLEEIKQKVSSGKHNFHNSMFDMGPIYGKQWRKVIEMGWHKEGETGIRYIDQIANLINDLKTNPDSRRLIVTAWNPSELKLMSLPPCHYGFQIYTRPTTREEKITNPGKYRAISLMWNQRSVDTFLGLPFNVASYGLLLEIIAKMTDMVPDKLIGNLGDVHLYEDHLFQAREQITRKPFALPKLEIDDQYWVSDCDLDTHILSMFIEDFKINDYRSHPTIKAPLIN
jgi:thymidylate synthase